MKAKLEMIGFPVAPKNVSILEVDEARSSSGNLVFTVIDHATQIKIPALPQELTLVVTA